MALRKALSFSGMWCWIAAEEQRHAGLGLLQKGAALLLCASSAAVRSNGAFTAALPLWFAGVAVLRVLSTSAINANSNATRTEAGRDRQTNKRPKRQQPTQPTAAGSRAAASAAGDVQSTAAALALPGWHGLVAIVVAVVKALGCCAVIWAPVFAFQEYGTLRLCGDGQCTN